MPTASRCLFTFVCVTLTLALPALSSGLEAVRQSPFFHSKAVCTDDGLTLTFDQSLDTGSLNDDSFFVTRLRTGEPAAGIVTVSSTHLPDDTVVFFPDAGWEWGTRYRLHVTPALLSVSGDPFEGGLPEEGIFVANIPDDFDMPAWDPSDPFSMFVETTALMGFNPMDPEAEAQPWQIPGSNVTGAWKYSVGRPDVIIAVLDAGIAGYDDPEVRHAFFLNAGELPLPNSAGEPCPDYDCNQDGRFNVDDYAWDNRFELPGPVSALDLIRTFSNGSDEDENGLPDDIAGWDFLRGVNQALGIQEVPLLGTHGDGQVKFIASRGDNGFGVRPGVCPDCTILPIRASANIIYDYNLLTAAVRYAASMGASVITLAGANFTWSQEAHQAFRDALDAGALTVAASGDEMTFHHWMPAAGEDILSVKSIFSLVPVDLIGPLNLEKIAFTETFCTNYGPHVHVAVPASSFCSSEATAATAGMVGLLFSHARDHGIDLDPLEAKQLLTMTAYDIKNRCASVANLCNVCQEGFDEHFGYGRPDLEKAMLAIGDTDLGIDPAIPPVVRIFEPAWWQTVDPERAAGLDVKGVIHSRVTPFTWRAQVAEGHEPLEARFQTVAQGTADAPLEGVIATVPLNEIFTEEWASGIPENQHSFEVTLRVQASYESKSRGTVTGEARKTISVHMDNDPHTGLVPGFPLWIGASGESSPILYDLDGDRDQRLEIVFGTGAGTVVALKYHNTSGVWGNMPGFPVDLSGNDPWVADSVFASVAVGDLSGDGTAEIVAATTGGKVYAFDPVQAAGDETLFLQGFPVSADPPENSSALAFFHGNGFMASPVLVDLDRDGMLEIVAASMDQKVYAWKPRGDSGRAERLAGWPVLCRSLAGLVPEHRVCKGNELPYPILGTPAAGILDPGSPDPHISEYPAVVVASNEACKGNLLAHTRVYAIFHDGMEHEGGPFLPGWPAMPLAPFSALLPIPFIAGASASPAVAIDGRGAHVAIGTTGWFPQLIHYSDGRVRTEDIPLLIDVNAIGSPGISSLFNDGELQFVLPMTGAVRVNETGFQLYNSRILALNMDDPHDLVMAGEVEDIPMLASCSMADLDNNGTREVLAGTGGYLVHAFSADGSEAPGWPKYTQKWVMATPVTGDMDADRRLEVVVHTREGVLYAWESEGLACPDGIPNSDWPRYHHDEHNTGFYGEDTVPPMRVVDLAVGEAEGGGLRLEFIATGDDWNCGWAASYDIRYSTDPAADLSDPALFPLALRAGDPPLPAEAGQSQSFLIDAPGARHVALQVKDPAGNLSRISNIAVVQGAGDGEEGGSGRCGCAVFQESSGSGFARAVITGFVSFLPFIFLWTHIRSLRKN